MKIDKLDLQKALAVVKPGLANQDVLEQTTSFAFIGGRVITYNDELSISHPVAGIDFTGVVNAEELYGLLSRLKKEEINVKFDDSELRITCGRVKAGLKLAEEIVLPIEEEIGVIKKWKKIPNPEQFKKHLSFAMKTCGNDMSQLKLTCVSVQKDGYIYGSDGFRMVQCKGESIGVDNFLIPATLVTEVLKINPIEIKIKGAWIHFRSKFDTIISTRMVMDKYISQDQLDIVLKNKGGKVIQFPKTIDRIIDLVGQFAKRDFTFDEIIYVLIKDGTILLKAEAIQTGSWVKENAVIDTKEELDFSLTPSLFIDILKETRDCFLSKDMKKASFSSKVGGWKYVIMLRDR